MARGHSYTAGPTPSSWRVGPPCGNKARTSCPYTNIPETRRCARAVAVLSRPRAAITIFGAGALLPALPYEGRVELRLRQPAGPRPLLLELLSFARDDEATGAAPTALCLYTRFDALALARVLGDARARACLKRDARGVGGDHGFRSGSSS